MKTINTEEKLDNIMNCYKGPRELRDTFKTKL